MTTLCRNNSENDIDSHKLRNALDLLVRELEVPFLEKRAKLKQHKKTPLEELNAVIQEITNREKELQAAVGIAKMLLDRNDELNSKRKKLFEKKNFYKSAVQHKEKDLESLKDKVYSLEEKYQLVKDTLCKTEEENLILIAENKRILYESAMRKEVVESNTSEDYENEIIDLKAEFSVQYEQIKKSKTELEKTLKFKEEDLKKLEKEKQIIEDINEKFLRDSVKRDKKLKDLENYLNDLEDQKSSLETKCRDLTVNNLKMQVQIEKLSEDLSVFQMPASTQIKKPKVRRQISLKCELESIEEPRFEYTSHHSYTLSRGISDKSLSVGLTETIAHIAAKKIKQSSATRRKDPSEEYFILVFFS